MPLLNLPAMHNFEALVDSQDFPAGHFDILPDRQGGMLDPLLLGYAEA